MLSKKGQSKKLSIEMAELATMANHFKFCYAIDFEGEMASLLNGEMAELAKSDTTDACADTMYCVPTSYVIE